MTAPYTPSVSATPPSTEPWTTRRLLAWMTDAFAKRGLDSPRLSGEILLAHVLQTQRLRLYTDPDREAAPFELEALRGLVGRALKHEPIQYLTGETYFFGLPIGVDARVLIPRPCTELIVEEVLQTIRRQMDSLMPVPPVPPPDSVVDHDADPETTPIRPIPKRDPRAAAEVVIADVCTGSGCIAVALAKNLPRARVVATDLAADALDVALANARRHRVEERIEFIAGRLLEPVAERVPGLAPEGLDFLVANPPYIPDHEWDAVEPNVKHFEPALALRGGPEGVDCVKPLIEHAPALLKPGGTLLIEIAASTADAVLGFALHHPRLHRAAILNDLEGLPRVLRAQRRDIGA